VYVLPDDEIERVAPSGWRLTSEEITCTGDACGQVTTGLYVSVAELQDESFMTDQLARAIGLLPPA